MSARTCLSIPRRADRKTRFSVSIDHANKRHESTLSLLTVSLDPLRALFTSPSAADIDSRIVRCVLAFIHRCSTSVLETIFHCDVVTAQTIKFLFLSLFLPFACRFMRFTLFLHYHFLFFSLFLFHFLSLSLSLSLISIF